MYATTVTMEGLENLTAFPGKFFFLVPYQFFFGKDDTGGTFGKVLLIQVWPDIFPMPFFE